MEPQNNNISGVSQTSATLGNSEQVQQTFHRKPVGLAITVEETDRVLADGQVQKWIVRRHRIKMRLVRLQLAVMKAKWRGN